MLQRVLLDDVNRQGLVDLVEGLLAVDAVVRVLAAPNVAVLDVESWDTVFDKGRGALVLSATNTRNTTTSKGFLSTQSPLLSL